MTLEVIQGGGANNNISLTVVWPKKGEAAKLGTTTQYMRSEVAAFSLLNDAGFQYQSAGARLDYGTLRDTRNQITSVNSESMRSFDALRVLSKGLADLALVGRNEFDDFVANCENNGKGTPALQIIKTFRKYSLCDLCFAGPKEIAIPQNIDELKTMLQGKKIATAYPETLKKFLKDNAISDVEIIECKGGVENTVRTDEADFILDIVQSGESLKANGLASIFTVASSSMVLVGNNRVLTQREQDARDTIIERLKSVGENTASQPAFATL